ncbi:MAG: HPt (histidine-containing phosphotransfer) domain-containing protein [Oleiphilaceae bacterium]|jgi:HPt (histidine-containing phosphotransfer) domain-containing protein
MIAESTSLNPFFDKEELLKRVINNHDLVKTLLTIFIEDMPEILNNLIQAAEDNNYDKVVLEAHNLKGSSYNLTVNKIGDLAKEIEKCGKEKDLDQVNALLPKLVEQLELTIDHFKCEIANK